MPVHVMGMLCICNICNYMHYMLVTSITLPLQAASNGRNYMHYMAHYMLSKMLMQSLSIPEGPIP